MHSTENQQTPAEIWENATLANNFLFCKIMTAYPEICRHLLEILLHTEIDHIELPQMEEPVIVDYSAKSVRLDVYTKNEGHVYDIEVQTAYKSDLAKRARYYQSIMDVDNLSKGTFSYKKLPENIVIFLCLDDYLHHGLPVYTFKNICREAPSIELGDDSKKIFFNASYYAKMETEEQRAFFEYLKTGESTSEFTASIQPLIENAKKNILWRKQFMTYEMAVKVEKEEALEQGRLEGRNEGILEGEKNKAIETARKLLIMGKLTIEEISEITGLNAAQVKDLM